VIKEQQGNGPTNLVTVREYEYDDPSDTLTGGGVGDGYLTKVTEIPGGSVADRVTRYVHDWRGRVQASKVNAASTTAYYFTYDNLDRMTGIEGYSGESAILNVGTATTGTSNPIEYASGTTASRLRSKETYAHDDRDQLFKSNQFKVTFTDSAATLGGSLQTDRWYDGRGNLIKEYTPGSGVYKFQHDGAGRLVASYLTNGGSDVAAGQTGTWDHADDLTGDRVIEQSTTIYDKGSRPVLHTTYERIDGTSPTTLALEPHNSFIQTTAAWYDKADRLTATALFGRDNGSTRYVFNINGSLIDTTPNNGLPDVAEGAAYAPNTSDNYIVTKFDHDSGGRPYRVTDNKGKITETQFDILGRPTKLIENYVNGVASETESDTDRTTNWQYDSKGRLFRLVAENPRGSGLGVESQNTTYQYSSTIDAGWATAVVYPDSTNTLTLNSSENELVSMTGNDHVSAAYDRLGRVTQQTDQRGVVHDYIFNTAGYLAEDRATNLGGTGLVDGTVRRLQYSYDDLGRIQLASSYDSVTGGNILNQVRHSYDGWGNVSKSDQSHSGAVTGSTPAVQYVYVDGDTGNGVAKHNRLSVIIYPNGREVGHGYGTIGDTISRVESIGDSVSVLGSSGVESAYTFIGSSRLASGYHGLQYLTVTYDRFGRVDKHVWTSESEWDSDVDGWAYTYDRNSNRLSRSFTGWVEDAPSNDFDTYTYDGLDRLASFNFSNAFTQTWSGAGATLDALGNWRTFVTDTNGTASGGTVTQTRTHNEANEILANPGNSPAWTTPVHDAAGNMTAMPKPGAESTQIDAKYDAWNRMVEAKENSTVTGSYRFDAFSRRVSKTIGSNTEYSYFSEDYQVLEVRKNTSTTPLEQNVWGTRYVDELIVRDRDSIPDDGSRDNSFSGDGLLTVDFGASDFGRRFAVQTDGKLLFVGWTGNSPNRDIAIARYHPDGTPDASFSGDGLHTIDISGSGSDDLGYAVTQLSSGKILIAGRSSGDTALVQLTASGAIDTSFGSGDGIVTHNLGGTDGAFDMLIDGDNKIVLSGWANGTEAIVVRLNSDASFDTGFGTNGKVNPYFGDAGSNDRAYAVALAAGGKLVVAGRIDDLAAVARLTSTGTADTTFSGNGVDTTAHGDALWDVAVQSDGKIVATGSLDNIDTVVVRFGSAGGLDTLFGGGDGYDLPGYGPGNGIALQPDGKILVASSDDTIDPQLYRYNTNGTLDTTFGTNGRVVENFGSGSESWVGVAHTWDGKIVVSGYGGGDFVAARYNAGVGLDQRLYVQQDANFNVTSVSNGNTVLERYRYTPYGQRTVLNNDFTADIDNTSDYSFDAGHQGLKHDPETGLIYNRARMLHPTLGRFTSRDPLGYVDGMSVYQAYLSSPKRFVDPSGLDSWFWETLDTFTDFANGALDDVTMGATGVLRDAVGLNGNGGVDTDSTSYAAGEYTAAGAQALTGAGAVKKAAQEVAERLAREALQALAEKAAREAAEKTAQKIRNKAHHIFEKTKHNLDELAKKIGSREDATKAIDDAAQAATKGLPDGVHKVVVDVQGTKVTVKGIVRDGAFELGTAWGPPLHP